MLGQGQGGAGSPRLQCRKAWAWKRGGSSRRVGLPCSEQVKAEMSGHEGATRRAVGGPLTFLASVLIRIPSITSPSPAPIPVLSATPPTSPSPHHRPRRHGHTHRCHCHPHVRFYHCRDRHS